MGFVSLSKSIRATMYIFPSFQQAGFSEGLLASNKQKCLQYSAKQPGSISHECWITLGVPQVCLSSHASFAVSFMTPTWSRGGTLVLLSTVFIGMGVLCFNSNLRDKINLKTLQRMFLFFVDSPIASDQAQIYQFEFLLLKLTLYFHSFFPQND